MASNNAKAEMEKTADGRLEKAVGQLAKRFKLDVPEPRNAAGDRQLKDIYSREDVATLLEQLVKATKPAGEKDPEPETPPAPEPAPEPTPAPEPQPTESPEPEPTPPPDEPRVPRRSK